MEKPSTLMTLPARLTKQGYIALWEKGGSMANIGTATIIADDQGKKPCAAFINPPGPISNREHALVPVHRGFYIIKSRQENENFEHEVYKVLKTFTKTENGRKNGFVEVRLINCFQQNKWENQLGKKLTSAVKTAEKKATTYLCRTALYVLPPVKK